MPRWLSGLGKALLHNGKIVGAGERHSLGNWFFQFPMKAARRWKYGVRLHGVRKWVGLSYKSWKFYR
jgi:hypothetical protein